MGAAGGLAAWMGATVLLLLPLYNPLLSNGGAHLFAMVIDTVGETAPWASPVIGLTLAAPWIARAVAGAEGRLAVGLLGPTNE